MSKPEVITRCVANAHAGPHERIVEFGVGKTESTHRGGLCAFRDKDNGDLEVSLYTLSPQVLVVVPENARVVRSGGVMLAPLPRKRPVGVTWGTDAEAELLEILVDATNGEDVETTRKRWATLPEQLREAMYDLGQTVFIHKFRKDT